MRVCLSEGRHRKLYSSTLIPSIPACPVLHAINNNNSPMPMPPVGLVSRAILPRLLRKSSQPLNARQNHHQPSRPHPYPHRSPHTAHPCVVCTANPGSSSSSVHAVCLVQKTSSNSSALRPALGRSARSTTLCTPAPAPFITTNGTTLGRK